MIRSAHQRDATIDVARGLAIITIVLGHVVAGVRASGEILTPLWMAQALPAVYLVHVVAFSLLAGLFVEHGVRTRGRVAYLLTRGALFGWLYLLWSVLQRGLRVLTGAGNAATSPSELLRLWAPEGQLWFLPWLYAATVLAVAVRPWSARGRGVALLAATTVLAWFAWGWEPHVVVLQGLALTPFFVGGVLLGGARLATMLARCPAWCLAMVLLLGAGVYLWVVASGATYLDPTAVGPDRSTPARLRGITGTVGGTIAVLALSALLARVRLVASGLAALGRRSMEIFLAHIVATSGVRTVLLVAGVHSNLAHVLVGTVAGVLVPLILAAAVDRLGWSWPFGLPRRLRDVVVKRSAKAPVPS